MNRILMVGALLWTVAALMACSGVDPGKCVQDFGNYTCRAGPGQDGGSEAALVGQSPQPPIPNPDRCWLCNMLPGTNGSFNTCTGQAGSCDDTRAHCSVIPIKCFYDAATCGYQCTELGAYDTCFGGWADCAISMALCGTEPLSCVDASPPDASPPVVGNACQVDGTPGATVQTYQCDAAFPFTWQDAAGMTHDCNDGVLCPAGTACTLIDSSGAPLTGACQ